MKIGSISTSQLLSTKTVSLGLFILALYFAVVTILLLGFVDYTNLMLGLTLMTCAILNAKKTPLVLSGVLVGLVGLTNFLAMGNVLPLNTAWIITLICVIVVFAFEIFGWKLGKASKQAKNAIIVPTLSLFFMFLLALTGLNPMLYVDWSTQLMKALFYVTLMFFTGLLSFQFLGWSVLKKKQGLWIAILAVLAVVISFVGVYQGSLSW